MRGLPDIEADIVSAETRLRSLKIERARAARVTLVERIAGRNRALLADLTAGIDRMEICRRHGVSYGVVANVAHAQRRQLGLARRRAVPAVDLRFAP